MQLDERLWLLELFHGPTLAFKDLALQLVGLLFDAVLARRGERVTIVGATSGDTGSAALDACRDRAGDRHLHPLPARPHLRGAAPADDDGRCGERACGRDRGHLRRLPGLVKALFADAALRRELNLSAVNSINFARIAAQIVYYIAAGLALGAPARAVSFSVPTGNFGNVYAGASARARSACRSSGW